MPRHLLSAKQVQGASGPDLEHKSKSHHRDHADGDGLYLRVSRSGAASWVLRYTAKGGARRELGLGGCDRQSLDIAGASMRRARKAAEDARDLIAKGDDPLDAKARARKEAKEKAEAAKASKEAVGATLRRQARSYHSKHVEPVLTHKHARQWLRSLEGEPAAGREERDKDKARLPDSLLDTPIADITRADILEAMVAICRKTPETGVRMFQRLALVFEDAALQGMRPDNPCTPHLQAMMISRSGIKDRDVEHHTAMPYRQIPDLLPKLRDMEGTAAAALEFTILTCARTGETLGAKWSEIDEGARLWRIPKERMKRRREHVVHLCDRAMAIIAAQKGLHPVWIFPTPQGKMDSPMSAMAMPNVLRRLGVDNIATVHGFRSSFRDWVAERKVAAGEIAELCLAHVRKNKVEAAYLRSSLLEERRALLNAWGEFLEGRPYHRADGTLVTDAAVISFPTAQQVAA